MTKENEYILHLTGIWAIHKYFVSFFKHGYKLEIEKNALIHLSSYYSQHIGLGINTNISKRPFLTIPAQLYSAINLLQIEKVVVALAEQRIYICFKNLEGDKKSWPDLPGFAIGFYFENSKKIHFLKENKKIDIKSHFFEKDDLTKTPIISKKTKLVKIDLHILKQLPVNLNQFINYNAHFDFNDIIENRSFESIEKYDVGYEPEFKGQVNFSPIHNDLEKKWDLKEQQKEIERLKKLEKEGKFLN